MPPQRARKGLLRVRTFSLIACAAVLALAARDGRADLIIGNLDQPHTFIPGDYNDSQVTTGDQVGAAIVIGGAAVNLQNVVINEQTFGPPQPQSAPGETFAIYSRNPDGTLGVPLFTNFTLNFVPMFTYTADPGTPTAHQAQSGLEIATPATPVTLSPNTGYFLVLSDIVPGTLVAWDYTSSTKYTSNGATMPATDTTVIRTGPTFTYVNLADGPQLFQVNGVAVPEPGPLALAAAAAGVTGAGCWWKKLRGGRAPEPASAA